MSPHRRSSSAGSAHSSRSRAEFASATMGPDGGEAGRRIAAEDEYIRRELTQTTSFCNAFWGQNDAGFEAISARMKASQRTLDELKYLYKERADIEADYAKRLAKLSRLALGHSETGALKAAFDVVKIELDTTSRTHSDLATMIKKDLEAAVTDFANRSWNTRKAAQANIEKLHKHKQTQENYVNKSREKYEQDCIKINGYTAQSSLVQGKDFDKVVYKLDKAQATVSQNDKDYQNFVRALKDTTVKWNAEWKAYLDQCQDQEEERLDFTKSNLWNFANAVSAVCVADDESCERIRVSLENVDTPRDVQLFIQCYGTGSLIPASPDYINYAKGHAPPARPPYHTAKFQRNTTRPTQLPVSQPPQQLLPGQQQQSPSHESPQPVSPQPPQPQSVVPPRNAHCQDKPVPPQPPQAPEPAQRPYESEYQQPPPTQPLNTATPSSAPPVSSSPVSTSAAPITSPQRRMSTKAFLARTCSLSQSKSPKTSQSSSRPAPVAPLGNGAPTNRPVPAASASTDDDDPIAKALASLRMRPGGKSPGPGQRESLSAESQLPPLFAQPGQIIQKMPPQHRAHSPSPSMAGNMPQRARSPSAAFMQAPQRAASPLPVEEVVGQYGQSFPGERKSLSRQNSVASRASGDVQKSPSKQPQQQQAEQGFAGVGARGRSPSPQPWGRTTQQQQHAVQSPKVPAPTNVDQPRTGTLSRRQSQIPPRSTTPLGIALDATGSVTHDQMAVDYMRRAGSVPPQQQQQPAAVVQQQQPARPPSVVHASYGQQGPPHHQAHPSVSSLYSSVPQVQNPYHGYQAAPPATDARQSYHGHAASPSVYSTVGTAAPPQQPQYGGYAGSSYGQAPQPVVAAGHMTQPSQQYAGSPTPGQQGSYPGAQPALGQQAYYAQPPPQQQAAGQYPAAQETPASAYMHDYLQQQQQGQPVHPNGVGGHVHQPGSASVVVAPHQQHYQQPPPPAQIQPQQQQQQQQQQTWGRATSPAPPPAITTSAATAQQPQTQTQPPPQPQPQPPMAQQQQQQPPAGHAPTGQYSDNGQPILFYVKALYDYQATNPDEFSFTLGDIIAVTHTEADGWWQGELLDEARRRHGANTFPSNFVALLM
ncbi:related to Cell division control protein 15 [Melanopsichium pennsylvanicum]|uniref:Related to Cell division control protein 15 n=2 Tax=Melanopsichium pennsylvanicum TaxID=63383 RepID=A0AAJ5C2J2_9BASI|nr:related to Cell division control protein 15 [Melanopsichium pennsylvanicum 4]SNX81479.1 related to Cell division control protein 15 [Melanopsichium pennsylvanicum]